MRRFLLLLALLFAPVTVSAQAAAPLRLDLNIPALRLVVYEGDRAVKSYPVAVGKPGYDTPTGEFSITHAEWNPWWRPPQGREWTRNKKVTPPGPDNPMGRVKLFFEPLYFIHGTPEAESVGSPASHGCVRMRNADVIALARLLHERSAAPVAGAEIDKILARPSNTRHVQLGTAVPLVIRYKPIEVQGAELVIYPDLYRRNALHSENVYQALMAAGYDPGAVDPKAVAGLLERARGHKGIYRTSLEDAFGTMVTANRD